MQVTQMSDPQAVQRMPLETYRVEPDPEQPFASVMSGMPEGEARAVFEKYSMRSITPREIDQMAQELRDAGYDNGAFLLELETHGESRALHLQEVSQEITGKAPDEAASAEAERRATEPFDLIGQMRDDAAEARRRGEPSAYLEQMALNFEWIENSMHGASGRGPWSSATAQSLVESRMSGE